MRLSPTLSFYFGRQFLIGVGIVLLLFIATIFIFDAVELLRRGAAKEQAGFGVLLEMAFFKLPFMAQKAVPFAVLVGAMLTFTRLTRHHELAVTRAAGVSVWQFLLPAIVLALAGGILLITVYNPLAAAMVARYEQMEATYLKGRPSLLAVSSSAGLWLRQGEGAHQSVIHARAIEEPGTVLTNVTIFQFEEDDRFVRRIDADSARLEEGYWAIEKAVMTAPDEPARFHDRFRLPTSLTLAQIQDSFAAPETLSFWALPAFIEVLERSGFSAIKHRIHFYSLLAGPLLLAAMVIIAASFSLRLTRRGGTGLLIVAGVLTGFVLYFLSDVVLALGLSGKIPPLLAAWTPAGISALAGIALLFRLEDG